jgi:hypothetical protein
MAFTRDEPEDLCDDLRPTLPWEEADTSDHHDNDLDVLSTKVAEVKVGDMMPHIKKEFPAGETFAVVTMAAPNQTESAEELQALMHPDIAVAPPMPHHRGNMTSAELETA